LLYLTALHSDCTAAVFFVFKVRYLWDAWQFKGSTAVYAAVFNILGISDICLQGEMKFVIGVILLCYGIMHSFSQGYKDTNWNIIIIAFQF